MTTPDDENEKHAQAELHPEVCREEPLLDPAKEEFYLLAMKDVGAYDEARVSDADARYYHDALPNVGEATQRCRVPLSTSM